MKLKIRKILALSMVIFILSGCGKINTKKDTDKKDVLNQNIEEIEETEKPKEDTKSPYTGEVLEDKVKDNLPIMTIVENSKAARPQSGLSFADIVFETMAEGGIPRFIALFHKDTPSKIGPIRSARAYFIDISKDFNLPFAHCGGSEEALNMISSQKLMSMNEMRYGSYYYRDKARKAPHNLYTSYDKLSALAKKQGYNKEAKSNLTFDNKYFQNNELLNCNELLLKLNSSYSTNYVFKDGLYYKSMDGKEMIDDLTKKTIGVTNIVIQVTTIKLQEDGKHLTINTKGSGDGYVISNGKYIKCKWEKKDNNSQPVFKDSSGKIVPLSEGKTWWHIIDVNNKVVIK